MIYVLFGNDRVKMKQKLDELLVTLRKKRPGAAEFKVEGDTWNSAFFEELSGSQGLFDTKNIVVLSNVLEVAREEVLATLPILEESQSMFLFTENELDKKTITLFTKHSHKLVEVSLGKQKKAVTFNMFSLTDALGARNKKNAWVLFRKAIGSGASAEEIQGILFWQVKTMLVARSSLSAVESKLNPFVYNKAKTYAKNFSPEELTGLLRDLTFLYHEARRGLADMESGIEKIILKM